MHNLSFLVVVPVGIPLLLLLLISLLPAAPLATSLVSLSLRSRLVRLRWRG